MTIVNTSARRAGPAPGRSRGRAPGNRETTDSGTGGTRVLGSGAGSGDATGSRAVAGARRWGGGSSTLSEDPLGRRRSPALVALGVLLACLGGLGGAWAWHSASHTESVLVMARSVDRGQTIGRGDVAVVSVAVADGVTRLPADQMGEIVGRHALVDLPAGTLPGRGSVGEVPVRRGKSHVGLKLAAGRLPAAEIAAGTRVTLVEISADEQKADPSGKAVPLLAVPGVITGATQRGEGSGERLVDVEVDVASAADLADLAARDRIALVREAS